MGSMSSKDDSDARNGLTVSTELNAKKENKTYCRKSRYSGSWYEDNAQSLNTTLSTYLTKTQELIEDEEPTCNEKRLRGLIVPHAGYAYSGLTAAYGYSELNRELRSSGTPIKHLLLLHPSHYHHLKNECSVSNASMIETPLGNINTSNELREEILRLHCFQSKSSTSKTPFTLSEQFVDEKEHSSEMQYPFIYKILKDCNTLNDVQVTSIMCGSLSYEMEKQYGALLSPIIARSDVLTIISTDFCHWGKRFSYQPLPMQSTCIPINQHIESLDRTGMDIIMTTKSYDFYSYLEETRNTICGRHPIGVYLSALETASEDKALLNQKSPTEPSGSMVSIKFIKYAQSSAAKTMSDSSVSYATAVAYM